MLQLPEITATSYGPGMGSRPEGAKSPGAIRHPDVSVLLFSLTGDLKCDLQFHFEDTKDLTLAAQNSAEMGFILKLLLCTDVKSRL